ncbi:plexin domain-containing protein 2-like [Drosophila innubila]|uniref:plexin domain-containing protein 2-like n=1 Tax=Drosophila innubila TaxID=198719 RepID=UPI00148D9ADB|nr:plexin domain-containing protein 2-like [Drosophila innubila]
MARIWTFLILLPNIYCLIWAAAAKGKCNPECADYDQTSSQISYNNVVLSDSEGYLVKRQRRDVIKKSDEKNTFYNIEKYVDKAETIRLWTEWNKMSLEEVFNDGYHKAKTLELPFDFPFFGQNIRKVTVTTGGFMYTVKQVHSGLAAIQYIAPLMANFKVDKSQDSRIFVVGNGTAFTVVWQNLVIKNGTMSKAFTFTATVQQNGEILFVYYNVPLRIDALDNSTHPVKVGLFDAYIFNSVFSGRTTIYEYTRSQIEQNAIIDGAVVRLKP